MDWRREDRVVRRWLRGRWWRLHISCGLRHTPHQHLSHSLLIGPNVTDELMTRNLNQIHRSTVPLIYARRLGIDDGLPTACGPTL